jgi:hypothetical protein
MFSKVRDNAPGILNKVSDVSGQIGRGLGTYAPIVSSIGVATGQPEIVALGGTMKANKLSQYTDRDNRSDLLQKARQAHDIGKQIIYN